MTHVPFFLEKFIVSVNKVLKIVLETDLALACVRFCFFLKCSSVGGWE